MTKSSIWRETRPTLSRLEARSGLDPHPDHRADPHPDHHRDHPVHSTGRGDRHAGASETSVAQTRILLSGLSGMFLDLILGIIDGEADFKVVGAVGEGVELEEAVRQLEPDIVVKGGAVAEGAGDQVGLLFLRRGLKVLEIAEGGRSGVLHELEPRQTRLCELSAQGLLAAIRSGGDDGLRR